MRGIKVEIVETYPGSQWWHLRVKLPGYGADHKGFFLLNIEELERKYGVNAEDLVREAALFRPEYAKTIKARLEKED